MYVCIGVRMGSEACVSHALAWEIMSHMDNCSLLEYKHVHMLTYLAGK